MNVNGPRNFNPNMRADLAKQVKDLAKLDEGKALGEAQQANTNNKPEGETEVDKTVIINWKDGGYEVKYDGIDNGVIINLFDGKFGSIQNNQDLHDLYRDDGEGFHPYDPE